MSNWREPFLKLKQNLRPLYDANLSIYHAVILSTNCSQDELRPVFEMLEPAYSGKNLVRTIPLSTDGCSYHGHLFFAEDRRGLDQLGRFLDGSEDWFNAIPPRFVPSFDIPPDRSQTNRNIARWVSLVYYLAWASDALYLDVDLEYQETVDQVRFSPWFECPQPPGCLPLKWLIRQGLEHTRIEQWSRKFEEREERIPDVIDAFMWGDLVANSMAAIDILVYILNAERREKSAGTEDYVKELQQKRSMTLKVTKEVKFLRMFLDAYHDPARCDYEEDERDPLTPLTANQIADKLDWFRPSGDLYLSKVSHRMKSIFGKNPMEEYKRLLAIQDDRERFQDILKGGKHAGERFVDSEIDDLDLD